jgi:2'-5' RNA ligase
VPPENWHFTLRFLGATNPEIRDQLLERLSATRLGSAFEIQFAQLGAFPKASRARVLWLGVDRGAEKLSALASVAERVAQSVGFVAEKRAFTPHLTLCRIDPPDTVAALIGSASKIPTKMPVDSVVLYRSALSSGPPRYVPVANFSLDD